MIHLSQLEHDALKGHQVGANRLAAVLTTSTCTSNCAYPFCFDKQPVSERAALQADLDIAAGKFTGLYQMRRDDAAIREQQQRLGQIGGGL